MDKEIIKKYVKDLDGLLKEMGEAISQPYVVVGENAVIFFFGRIFKYLNFDDFLIGHQKDLENKLDAWAWMEKDNKEIFVEFESRSKNFKKHIIKGHIKPEDYKNTLIVCWDDDWNECPSEIDIMALGLYWKQAQKG